MVRFMFAGKVDVRTFREDKSYVVDVTPMEAKATRSEGSVRSDELAAFAADLAANKSAPPADVTPPQTVPARNDRSARAAGRRRKLRLRAVVPAAPPVAAPRENAPALAPRENATEVRRAQQGSIAGDHHTAAGRRRAGAEGATPRLTSRRAAAATPAPVPAPRACTAACRRSAGARNRAGPRAARRQPDHRGCAQAAGRQSEPVVSVRGADAGGGVPPRRHAVAGVRHRRGDRACRLRRRAEPAPSGARPRPATATRRWCASSSSGRGSSARPPTAPAGPSRSATRWSSRRGRSPSVRNIVGPARASITIPFDDPRRLHRLDDPEIGDTLLVVTALGAGARLPQAPGLRRVPRARLDPRRRGAAARRRSQRRARRRQDRARAARGPHPVDRRRCRAAHGQRRAAAARARPADLGLRPPGRFRRAQLAADPRRRRRRRKPSATSRALDLARFYLARDMCAEAKAVLDVALADSPPTAEDSDRAGAARHRQYHARPPRRRRSRISPIRSSATSTTRRSGARSPMRGRANGAKRAKASATSRRRSARCRSSCSARCCKDMVRAAIEVGDIAGAAKQLQRIRDRRRAARARADARGAHRPAGRRRSAASRMRCAPTAPPPTPGIVRRPRRAGCARSLLRHHARQPDARRRASPSSRRSPRSGAATRPRSRRCSCWRASTPRSGATATPSTSCAPRSRRIRTPR